MSELSELPQGWAWTRLDRIASWGSGGTPKSGQLDYYDGNIPWAVIGDLTDSTVTTTANSITSLGLENSSAKFASASSVLIAMYGSIGKLGLPTIPLATNQAIAFVEPFVGCITRKFLFWYLMHCRPDLIRAGKGGTQQNISQTILKSWLIPLPPLAEQRRIVEALEEQLSRLDACNASLDAAERKLSKFIDRIIITEVERLNPGLIPLSEFLSTKPRNGRSVPTADEGFPVLRLTALRGDKVDLAQFKIGDWNESTAEPFPVQHKDILLSRGNGSLHLVGRAALVKDHPEPVAYPDTMIRLKPDLNRLDPAFFVRYWNSPSIRHQIEMKARTTAGIYKINQSILQDISFPDLSIDVQRKLASEIDDFKSQNLRIISAVENAKIRAARLRAGLLESAFAGTLVDQDPADEPASVLLERIATERASEKTTVRRRTSGKTEVKV